jgi:SDR family mycofactocin-dependent oxidoreductase
MSKKQNSTNPITRRGIVLGGAASLAGATALGTQQPQTIAQQSEERSQTQSSNSENLSGRVALITGDARGIGRATAIALARQGADVAILDIANPQGVKNIQGYQLATTDDLDESIRQVEAQGRKALPLIADVRDLDAMKAAANKTVAQLGRLDIMVANAGIGSWSQFAKMTPGQWKDVLDVNLTGVANSMWAVIPQMQKQKSGKIIALTSIGGRQGVSGVSNYAATKWGVIGLVKSIALELGADNITVNAVAPTAVNTPLYRSEGQYRSTGMNSFEEQDQTMLQMHALPVPAVEPEDIANAIVFLAGDTARYITGAVIDVAAGFNARYTA